MPATTDESQFRLAVLAGKATAVPMNSMACAVFSQTPCIGTDGLGSCSVVLILSPLAVILAHIPPLPHDTNSDDPLAGDKHVQEFMQRITRYYRQCQAYFRPTSGSWVICAVYQGAVALPDQQRIVETSLRNEGLSVESPTYHVPVENDHPDRGSVFVDSRNNMIRVFVENTEIRRFSTEATIATAGSSAHRKWWRWEPQLQEYQCCIDAEVEYSQNNMPSNVWIYSKIPWKDDKKWALYDNSNMYYRD